MGNACVSIKDGIVLCTESRHESISTNGVSNIRSKPANDILNAADGYKRVASTSISTFNQFRKHFSLGRRIGQGRFGTVYICVENATGKEYACKLIQKKKLVRDKDIEDLAREIQIMWHLSGHPNVASMKEAYEDPETVKIVMELCEGGELFDRIKLQGKFSEQKAAETIKTIVEVLEYLHSLGVMHRDLKPENFLFVDQQEDSPLKAIDFGLSTFFKEGEKFSDIVGSAYYIAPEVLRKKYGPEADIWSAGVILYILLSGRPPFWEEKEPKILNHVLNGELDLLSDPWPVISENAKDLVRRMIDRNPLTRITSIEVLCHPWILANT